MIDAYEIGIQLLLQDDVSAGLAVINRGLADVDRAIAATSTGLVGLVREAETATKAIATAVGGRPVLAEAPDHQTGGSIEQAAQRRSDSIGDTSPAALSVLKPDAPEMKQAEQPVSTARVMEAPSRDERTLPQQDVLVSSVAPSTPMTRGSDEEAQGAQPPDKEPALPMPKAFQVPAQAASPAQKSKEIGPSSPVKQIAATVQEPRRSMMQAITPVAPSAFVSQVQQQKTNVTQAEAGRHRSTTEFSIKRERPVAPWTGVDHLRPHTETARLNDRATAPQAESKQQSASDGGAVMLDGRVVGQWLSEHMGREASRPPVGTSFFDPRQTPAWTVSGAL